MALRREPRQDLQGALRLFWFAVAQALIQAAVIWLFYVALEPYVRRRSPHRIISWSRLMAGNWRDPLVGRDILLGLIIGLGGTSLVDFGGELIARRLGRPAMTSVQFFFFMNLFYTYTTDLSAWYARAAVFALVVCAAFALYGFVTSLAGRPILRADRFD